MKKTLGSLSLILLTVPFLSSAQNVPNDNTERSFAESKYQDIQNTLAASSTKNESIKIFRDLFKYGSDKLQSRLENILKDKENYPEVANEVNSFKANIRSTIEKFKTSNKTFSISKQINVKKVLNKELFKTLDNKISKLESADTKMTEKISLLISSNVNASSTANLLSDAEQKLVVARSSVTEIESQINTAMSSQTGVSTGAIKQSILDANDKILAAVNSYKLVLDSIAEISNTTTNDPSDQVISTPLTNDQPSSQSTSSTIDQNQQDLSNTSIGVTSDTNQNN